MTTMRLEMLLPVLVLFGVWDNLSRAQEAPDLLGSWAFTVEGQEADPRCGEISQTGVLDIERQITARAYRGSLRSDVTSAKCRGTETNASGVTIRVKGDVVTVVYDEEGWKEDKLLFKGATMEGSRGNGIKTHWRRLENGSTDDAPTPEQVAELNELFGELRPELEAALNEKYGLNLEKNLVKTGLTDDESRQVAEQTIVRLADCMLETLRESILAQELPVRRVLEQRNLAVVFDPRSMDMESSQCVADASLNAGIQIR